MRGDNNVDGERRMKQPMKAGTLARSWCRVSFMRHPTGCVGPYIGPDLRDEERGRMVAFCIPPTRVLNFMGGKQKGGWGG